MNKLIAISVALLSVSLYGADKTPNELRLEEEIEKLKKEVRLQQIKIALGPEQFKSKTGLEGIAKHGLYIFVPDYSKIDKTFDKNAIEAQVELRLKLAGIVASLLLGQLHHKPELPPISPSIPYLYTNVYPISSINKELVGYTVTIEARREVTFEANGKTYKKVARVWESSFGRGSKDNVREYINKIMDRFLLDYLKANPKKKE